MAQAEIIMHDPILLAGLQRLVLDAGISILEIYQQDNLVVQTKHDHSPVTAADLAAHQVIVKGLACLTPHLAVVSEEDKQSHKQASSHGVYWLIDPLDGTREFINRNGEFTVNIALIEQGSCSLGLVGVPVQTKLYWGGRGLGSYRMVGATGLADPLRVVAAQTPARVLVSRSHLNQATSQFVQDLGETTLIQMGSSIKFLAIAEGRADWYPRLGPTCEWDTAAAQAVLEGAGGYVTRLDGQPLQYGKQNIINPHFMARGGKL